MLGHASARENEVAITILSATGKNKSFHSKCPSRRVQVEERAAPPAGSRGKNNLLEQHNQQLKSELADANLRMQQMVECHSPESNEPCRNLTIEKAAQFVPMNDTSKLPPQKKSLVINESEG